MSLLASELAHAQAAAPKLIPFQARVTDVANAPLNGVYGVTFAIYDAATGGTAKWVEPHSNVSIVGGTLNVFLGSLVSLEDPNGDSNPADAVSFGASSGSRFVGIRIGAGAEMVPRHQLVPAFHARVADTVENDGVTTSQIQDGAVTLEKLDPNAGVPVGGIVMWWGTTSTIPTGFELCDGGTVQTANAVLTGLKPDLRGRFARGADAGIADVSTSPVSGGDDDTPAYTGPFTLQVPHLPNYLLAVSAAVGFSNPHDHQQQFCADDDNGNGPYFGLGDGNGAVPCPNPSTNPGGVHDHSISVNVGSNGGNAPHDHPLGFDNRPEFLNVLYIIRVK